MVALGNARLPSDLGIEPRRHADRAEALRREGQIGMFVGVVMMNGDSRTTADAVARTLALDEVLSQDCS